MSRQRSRPRVDGARDGGTDVKSVPPFFDERRFRERAKRPVFRIWSLLRFVFLPWPTLMYVIAFPVYGFGWFLLELGLAADIASYASAAYRRRDVPYYSGP